MVSNEPAGVVVWYVFVEILEENLPLLHLAGHAFPLKLRLLHCQEEDQRHVGCPGKLRGVFAQQGRCRDGWFEG